MGISRKEVRVCCYSGQNKQDWEEAYSDELKTQTAKYLMEVDCFSESIELLNMLNETGKDQ